MRFSRGQNPPYGNDPASRETPDAAVPETERRADERASWFAPPPPPESPAAERPRDPSGGTRGAASPGTQRTPPPAPESFDPDDLYPPEYQPGNGRGTARAPLSPRDPGASYSRTREPYPQRREPASPRDDGNRTPYERLPRERAAGNEGGNTRPSWSRDAAPPAPPPISERFGWQDPERDRPRALAPPPRNPPLSAYWEEREERLRQEDSGQLPRISPPGTGAYDPSTSGVWPTVSAPDRAFDLSAGASASPLNGEGTYSPYSQQIILPPDAFTDAGAQTAYDSSAYPAPMPGESAQTGAYRPGAFPTDEAYEGHDGGRMYAAPVSVTRSGRLATTGRPGTSGAFAAIPGAMPAPDRAPAPARAPVPALITDPVVWSFLLLALALTGAIIAFVALRYDSFPQQITLHFGPAGASQRDRIGERRELWTIPFLSVIVFVANTALAFVFDFFDRRDRFVPRLLAIGSALVAAVAWVVLLTLLYR